MTSISPVPIAAPQSGEFSFLSSLRYHWGYGRLLCIGLDSDYTRLPASVRHGCSLGEAILAFNTAIIEATHRFVCCYKPNSAFYEAQGPEGTEALRQTIALIKERHPKIPVLLDAKRGDIGSTSEAYAHTVFSVLGADAVTVSPYLGRDALQPFLSYKGKGIFILAKTSNPRAAEFQDLPVPDGHGSTEPLYLHIARTAAWQWNEHGNIGLVVGATQPEALAAVRREVGDVPLLIPGIGAQGGDLRTILESGVDSNGGGMIINVARSVIFASRGDDFAEAAHAAARHTAEEILQWR